MKKKSMVLFFLASLLVACQETTYQQRRIVEDACHAAGLNSRSDFYQIRCWRD